MTSCLTSWWTFLPWPPLASFLSLISRCKLPIAVLSASIWSRKPQYLRLVSVSFVAGRGRLPGPFHANSQTLSLQPVSVGAMGVAVLLRGAVSRSPSGLFASRGRMTCCQSRYCNVVSRADDQSRSACCLRRQVYALGNVCEDHPDQLFSGGMKLHITPGSAVTCRSS